MTPRLRWALAYPFSLTVVPRSPVHPVGAGRGQCWLDAIDAASECSGCDRLPHEGCRCARVLTFPARPPRRRVAEIPAQRVAA